MSGNNDRQQHLDFGAWVRSRRTALRLTIEEAKARAGVSRDVWNTIELGGRTKDGVWIAPNPRSQTLMAIADALELPIAEVFHRAGLEPPRVYEPMIAATSPEGEQLLARLLDAISSLTEEVRANRQELDLARQEIAELKRPESPAPRRARPAKR